MVVVKGKKLEFLYRYYLNESRVNRRTDGLHLICYDNFVIIEVP